MAGCHVGHPRFRAMFEAVSRQSGGGPRVCARAAGWHDAGRIAVTSPDSEAFIRANTCPGAPPLVPEIALFLATEITPIWQATEDWLQERALEPPLWAFAWPGGQAL